MISDPIIIDSKSGPYKVLFDSSLSKLEAISVDPDVFFLIDKKVYGLYKEIFFKKISKNKFFLIEAIETNKDYLSISNIIPSLTDLSIKKDLTIVSIGGGIIQDISGFISSILYRGIKWIYIPTTLLAQSDSCIGAKTSINFKSYKNLLGTFWAPKEVWISINFLDTLNTKDFYSGIGEIIKLFLINGKKSLDFYSKLSINSEKSLRNNIFHLLRRSLLIKKIYIEKDEFDKGIRNVLNFGHCIGHAIESASEYLIPHGQAVTLGMIWANIISVKNNKLSLINSKMIFNNFLKNNHTISNELSLLNPENIINAMKKDKKRQGLDLAIILMDNNYSFSRIHNLKEDLIFETYNDFICLFK